MLTPHILIADDHFIARMGVSLIVKKVFPGAVIEQTDNYAGVLSWVAKQAFDLVVLDVNMPNGNLQATLDVVKAKQRHTKVLVFSSLDEELYAARYLKAGADGFVQKYADEETIKTALVRVMQRGHFISEKVRDNLVNQSLQQKKHTDNPLATLSDRELEIARLLVAGMGLKAISHQLNVHVATVSTYKTRLFRKLNISSLVELGDFFKSDLS